MLEQSKKFGKKGLTEKGIKSVMKKDSSHISIKDMADHYYAKATAGTDGREFQLKTQMYLINSQKYQEQSPSRSIPPPVQLKNPKYAPPKPANYISAPARYSKAYRKKFEKSKRT